MTPPSPADPLSAAQIDAALAVVTRAWPDERTGAVALVAAVLCLGDDEVAEWSEACLADALQAVSDRLNAWADQSHAAGLASRSPRSGKPTCSSFIHPRRRRPARRNT